MVFVVALAHLLFLIIIAANLRYLRRPAHLRSEGDRTSSTEPDAQPAVTILIPARNEADNLRRLLPSLTDQRYDAFDIVVYDDGSEDATAEVLSTAGDGVTALHGDGPPPGWLGKPHALYWATREATGDLYLFLDADTQLADPDALARIVDAFRVLPERSILTALPRLRGGGLLLVSMVPNTILGGLPWPLVRRLPIPSMGALNGQCWMMDAQAYHHYEPHLHVQGEVLEDVMIGRYLKREGWTPVLTDLRDELHVFMYTDLRDAWQGFRKNAYLLAGGTPLAFVPLYVFFLCCFTLSYLFHPALLGSLYLVKLVTDRYSRFPLWVSLLAPLSYALSSVLQLDSAISHWTGRVAWKGRRVARRAVTPTPS